MNNKLLIICGPTASGKTSLSIECAKKLNTEIISADSLLIYKGLNIGTAKPTVEEMEGIKHHLIDVASPFDNFTVSDYEKAALPIIENLFSKGKIPIICGGTGYYIDSLIYKRSYGNCVNEKIRQKYENILELKGKEYLYSLLQEVDLESANKLHYNDVKRVIRALEIYECTGVPKSMQNNMREKRYDFKAYCIDYPRNILYDRINKRVDKMFSLGLIDEVKELLKKGVNVNNQSIQGIGYKEIVEYINKNIVFNSSMSDIIKQNSRNYAKRQITYFKKTENLQKLNYELPVNTLADIVINDFLIEG